MNRNKIYIEEDFKSKADYLVFFTEFITQESNEGIIKGGEIVDDIALADLSIYLTEWKNEADIFIMKENFPA